MHRMLKQRKAIGGWGPFIFTLSTWPSSMASHKNEQMLVCDTAGLTYFADIQSAGRRRPFYDSSTILY